MHPNMGLQARAIMHLAATPIDFPQDAPFGGIATFRSPPCHLQAANDRHAPLAPASMMCQPLQTGRFRMDGLFTLVNLYNLLGL